MNVSKGSERVVLQAHTEAEQRFLRGVRKALAGETDGLAWWTLDTPEYPALDDHRDVGALGEKALVVSWGRLEETEPNREFFPYIEVYGDV